MSRLHCSKLGQFYSIKERFVKSFNSPTVYMQIVDLRVQQTPKNRRNIWRTYQETYGHPRGSQVWESKWDVQAVGTLGESFDKCQNWGEGSHFIPSFRHINAPHLPSAHSLQILGDISHIVLLRHCDSHTLNESKISCQVFKNLKC